MERPLLTGLLAIGLLAGNVAAASSALAAEGDDEMAFGMGAGSLDEQEAAGVKPDYQTFWIGPWVFQQDGWGGYTDQMEYMQANGVTPAIHLYYWGDDISPKCVEDGCWSDIHNTHKDRQEWQKLTQQLVDQLWKHMDGDRVVIFLETEFNHYGIEDYEPFDDYMVDKIQFIKEQYPAAEIVLPFGNWKQWAWDTFDESAAAADYVGLQGMRGSTQDSWNSYHDLYEETLKGADRLHNLFGKPVFLQDIALSSYPEPDYVDPQANELSEFFEGMGNLKSAGVEAMTYRSWYDNPSANSANYYGQAEKHWGLAYPDSGQWKPAAQVWVDGVKAERSGQTQDTTSNQTDDYPAQFSPKSQDQNWWIEVEVDAYPEPAAVEARVDGGDWVNLTKRDWGTWAVSTYAADGATVEFRAISPDGHQTRSVEYIWGDAGGNSSGGWDVSFTPKSQDQNWWIEVDADGSPDPDLVQARIDGREWFDLQERDWGTWALSKHAEDGATVEFRAMNSDGERDRSQEFVWGDPSQATNDSVGDDYPVEFSPTGQDNNWWIEVSTDAYPEPVEVEAQIENRGWFDLQKQDWGHWGLSKHVEDGAQVQFRAISPDGHHTKSDTYVWGDPSQAQNNSVGDDYPVEFSPTGQDNNWWIEVNADAYPEPTDVEARIDGGSWFDLQKQDWGHWALSKHVDDGAHVQFRAISPDGHHTKSEAYVWGDPSQAQNNSVGEEYPVAFSPTAQGNDWWIEVAVDADPAPQEVEARINGGEWFDLEKQDWGHWALSKHVEDGAEVQFRAISSQEHGHHHTSSGTYIWN